MATKDVAALGEAASQLVSVIQDLGIDYFRADAAWTEDPCRVKVLAFSYEDLLKKLEKYAYLLGHDTDTSVLEAVKDATKLLDAEVAKLSKRSAKSKSCVRNCLRLLKQLFPESVDTYLRVAEGAYGKISQRLGARLQNDAALREIRERLYVRLPFSADERYVSLDVSERKIFSALQEAGTDRAVVLLSGGPGKGKSTLARQICLRYRDKRAPFTHLVMLECGPNIDVAAKKMELLQKLGGHLSQKSRGADFNVSKGLQDRLSNPKLLVILDDLCERELISDLVNLPGSGARAGAKWLVTSQHKNICGSVNCKCVMHEIEHLTQEDARKILASHAGCKDKNIPPHLQNVADEIIQQAQATPLVLATLGARITNAGRGSLEVWESVLDDLFACLDGETLVSLHGVTYPSSFLATMKRYIDFLNCDQKQLLVLISICRSPSIPKSALQFLCNIAVSPGECSVADFPTLCHGLEARHLLAENDAEVLSIHSLTREVVLDQMDGIVQHVTTLLNEGRSDAKRNALSSTKASVTRVLADLFIDAKFRSRATAVQRDHPSDLLASNNATLEVKRTTTESILELLVLKVRPNNDWTEELGMCAEQVLLEFVDKDCLDQKSISKLLGSSRSVLPILTFLKNVCLLEKSIWEGNYIKSTSSIPQALLNLLRDNSCTESQNRATSVLADLCWSHKENSITFARTLGMLPQLSLFLTQVQSSDLQKYAGKVLAAFAYWDYYCDGTVKSVIVAAPGLVDSLVGLLTRDDNAGVQNAAGHALSNLTTGKPTVTHTGAIESRLLDQCLRENKRVVFGDHRDAMAQWPGLLEELVKSLTKTENPVLQAHASSTLANIAGSNESSTLETLLDHPGLVDKLVSALCEDQNSRLQEQSARAIRNLATYRAGSPIREKILDWPGLLEGLATSLLKTENTSLQVTAAKAISHLTFRIEKNTANRVLNHSGLADNLVQLLDANQHSCVQAAAPVVSALCSLTDVSDDSLREKIVSSPPLLARLAESVLTGENRAFEADVVCLLANLAVTNAKGIIDKIANSPGLVNKLAKSLAEDESSLLQVNAMRTLLNLTGEENNDTFDISCFHGLLRRLRVALLQRKHLVMRETMLTALTCLRAMEEKAGVDREVDTWALLDEFTKGLSKDGNVMMRETEADV